MGSSKKESYNNKEILAPFHGWASTISRLQSPYKDTVCFFTIQLPRTSYYSTDQPRKNERLKKPCSHPLVLNPRPLIWVSSALTTRLFLHKKFKNVLTKELLEHC